MLIEQSLNRQWYFPALVLLKRYCTEQRASHRSLMLWLLIGVIVRAVMHGGEIRKVCKYPNDWRKYTEGAYWKDAPAEGGGGGASTRSSMKGGTRTTCSAVSSTTDTFPSRVLMQPCLYVLASSCV